VAAVAAAGRARPAAAGAAAAAASDRTADRAARRAPAPRFRSSALRFTVPRRTGGLRDIAIATGQTTPARLCAPAHRGAAHDRTAMPYQFSIRSPLTVTIAGLAIAATLAQSREQLAGGTDT